MSVVSRRPSVKSVSNPAITAAVVGGAFLIGRLIRAAVREMSAAPALVPADAAGPDAADLVPFATIRRQVGEDVRSAGSPPAARENVEAAKVSALRPWTAAACYATPEAVPYIRAVARAKTVEEVHAARIALVNVIARQHQAIVVDALTLACKNAAMATGLTATEVARVDGGVVRVTSTDEDGRGIVSEIDAQPSGEIAMASEVVGGEGACHAMLDAFERALEREGVRSDSPDRRSTGGLCQLEAAKDAAKRFLRRRTVGETSTTSDEAMRRREELARRRRVNAPKRVRER